MLKAITLLLLWFATKTQHISNQATDQETSIVSEELDKNTPQRQLASMTYNDSSPPTIIHTMPIRVFSRFEDVFYINISSTYFFADTTGQSLDLNVTYDGYVFPGFQYPLGFSFNKDTEVLRVEIYRLTEPIYIFVVIASNEYGSAKQPLFLIEERQISTPSPYVVIENEKYNILWLMIALGVGGCFVTFFCLYARYKIKIAEILAIQEHTTHVKPTN